ncbi:MAG: topoisomerase IV, partial [Ruthenibacterium sp.]
SAGRLLLVSSAQIPAKATKNTAGVNVLTLKKNQSITSVRHADAMELENPHRYRVRTLPAAGALLRAEDLAEQIQLTL